MKTRRTFLKTGACAGAGLLMPWKVFLINEAPDEPFGGGEPGKEFEPANLGTTGQIMRFNVVPLTRADTSLPVEQLTLPALNALPEPLLVRRLSLNEDMSAVLQDVGPRAALLGILDGEGNPIPLMWEDAATERIQVGPTELWEIYNFTEDAHPIHIHQIQFQVVNRQHLVTEDEGVAAVPASLFGDAFPPEPWETGFKDTVIAYPGQVTRLKIKFDLPGRFTWHCHILEHEDNEMMRPLEVLAG